jgi:hypothetical protein
MRLRQITLRHFRNVGFATLEFSGRQHFLLGRNGQGKTNLLEAAGLPHRAAFVSRHRKPAPDRPRAALRGPVVSDRPRPTGADEGESHVAARRQGIVVRRRAGDAAGGSPGALSDGGLLLAGPAAGARIAGGAAALARPDAGGDGLRLPADPADGDAGAGGAECAVEVGAGDAGGVRGLRGDAGAGGGGSDSRAGRTGCGPWARRWRRRMRG